MRANERAGVWGGTTPENVFLQQQTFADGAIVLQVRSNWPVLAIQDRYPRLADELTATWLWKEDR